MISENLPLAPLLQNLWDLLWNNENWTSFYNNGNGLSIRDVAILVHLRNRLSVLHVVSQDLKTQMPFNLKLSSLLHSTYAREEKFQDLYR